MEVKEPHWDCWGRRFTPNNRPAGPEIAPKGFPGNFLCGSRILVTGRHGRMDGGRNRIAARHERSGRVDCLLDATFEPSSTDSQPTSSSLQIGQITPRPALPDMRYNSSEPVQHVRIRVINIRSPLYFFLGLFSDQGRTIMIARFTCRFHWPWRAILAFGSLPEITPAAYKARDSAAWVILNI
jgi:hypothetical protein